MIMVRMKYVTSKYNGVQVLKDVNLAVEEGDFLVLFGADDEGKTTLLHILMGFNTSYSGKVALMESRPNNLNVEQRSQVRFVPDSLILEPGMTGADYLQYAKDAAGAYDEALQWALCEENAVSLEKELEYMTAQENKLVQVIGAVCAGPRLLILDEPSNFLGRQAYALLLKHLGQWNRKGMTVLLAAEQYEAAGGFCSRYAYLKGGRIIVDSSAPSGEQRGKIITVAGGKGEVLKKYLPNCISRYDGKTVHYYKGDMQRLALILYYAACEDWAVEELTLREELDGDFSRWDVYGQ